MLWLWIIIGLLLVVIGVLVWLLWSVATWLPKPPNW